MSPTKPAAPRPAARRRSHDTAPDAARSPGRQPGNARPPQTQPRPDGAGPLVSIDDILADLAAKQARLSALLDSTDPDDLASLTKLFSLHAQNASRMGRLLRDQRALSGAAADGIAGAIAQALDELATELETPL